jgi:hypothetical protein
MRVIRRPQINIFVEYFSDYLNSMDLHIGVTNSEGNVVEYDKGGLQQHRARLWCQCLVVDGAAGPWREHWDSTLKVMTNQECWSPQMYVIIATYS